MRRPSSPIFPNTIGQSKTSLAPAYSETVYQALLREVRESRTVSAGAILLMEALSRQLHAALAARNMAAVAAVSAQIGSSGPGFVAALLENT